MSGHVLPLKTYLAVFFGLLLMTALTTGIAYVDLGEWNTVIAISIAVFKALLVVLWFMHVKFSTTVVKVFVIAGAYWLLILFGFLMSDYFTRPFVPGWGG